MDVKANASKAFQFHSDIYIKSGIFEMHVASSRQHKDMGALQGFEQCMVWEVDPTRIFHHVFPVWKSLSLYYPQKWILT